MIPASALLFLSCLVGAPADSKAVRSFHEGNALYLAGEYLSASRAYGEGFATGKNPGIFHFNQGNCFFRTGSYGRALHSYLAARHYLPRDSRIRHNIRVARLRLGSEPDLSWTQRIGERLLLLTGTESLTIASILGGVTLLLWALRFRRKGPILRRLAWAGLAAALLMGFLGLLISHGFGAARGVSVQACEALGDPGEGGRVLFTLREGEEVRLLENRSSWRLVQGGRGLRGWVDEDLVLPLPP